MKAPCHTSYTLGPPVPPKIRKVDILHKGGKIWYLNIADNYVCYSTTVSTDRPIYRSSLTCWSNNELSGSFSWFDLGMTLIWPPVWNPPPTHVTTCTCLGFRPSYMTHSYTTLRVKGTLLRWPLVTLSMYKKSADHLKVTWYIVRLKNMVYKIPRGGGRFSTFSPWSIWYIVTIPLVCILLVCIMVYEPFQSGTVLYVIFWRIKTIHARKEIKCL